MCVSTFVQVCMSLEQSTRKRIWTHFTIKMLLFPCLEMRLCELYIYILCRDSELIISHMRFVLGFVYSTTNLSKLDLWGKQHHDAIPFIRSLKIEYYSAAIHLGSANTNISKCFVVNLSSVQRIPKGLDDSTDNYECTAARRFWLFWWENNLQICWRDSGHDWQQSHQVNQMN